MVMLSVMLAEIRRRGFDFAGRFFDVDGGYDSDCNCNCEEPFWMDLIPSIMQRKDVANRGKPSRKETRLFNADEYRKRALIEGIFVAEETRRHQLHRRFVRLSVFCSYSRTVKPAFPLSKKPVGLQTTKDSKRPVACGRLHTRPYRPKPADGG